MTNDRAVILETLLAIKKGEDFSNVIIKNVLDKYSFLDRQNRGFIKRVTEGTLERQLELDYIINQFSSTKTSKMKPVILTILEMGVYQLKYMDAVPASAVCNEAVKLAEKKGFHTLKGFVNGVLRNISRNMDTVAYPTERCEYLSIKYSMPKWIVSLFLQEQGDELTEKMLQDFLEPKAVTIRTNLSKLSKKELEDALNKENTGTEKAPYLDYAIRLTGVDAINALSAYQKGYFQVQDVSSMLVCELAGIEAGARVLDVCAAPGGKACHAADMLAGTGGMVYASDLTEAKTALIEEHRERCGFDNLKVAVWDATKLKHEAVETADIVIADLPCSGLGIMGKKNDIKYHITEERMAALVSLQREILSVVSRYVKPGGILMFSTCTIHRAENEDNVQWIKENLPFEPVSLEAWLPEKLAVPTAKAGYIQLLPGLHETDGFFIAKFKRSL